MPIDDTNAKAVRYHFYRHLILMPWLSVRDLRLNIRLASETRNEINAIKLAMGRANPSDADVVAWSVALMARHMATSGELMPQSINEVLPVL